MIRQGILNTMDTLDTQKVLTAVLGIVFALYMGLLTWNAVRMVDRFESLEGRVREVEIREAGSTAARSEILRRLDRMEILLEDIKRRD